MLTLVVGNKNYSSWSMRPWLVLRTAGAKFEEVVIGLDQPDTAERIRRYSPSGRVPALIDGELSVWDSLAIAETIAERFPESGLWPEGANDRAQARAIAAEMHSGFSSLRNELPMKLRETFPFRPPSPETQKDIDRVVEIWTRFTTRSAGPFLFGKRFGIADAMYAPVVGRFRTYAIPIPAAARAYADAVQAYPPYQEWFKAAQTETLRAARYEVKPSP